MLRQPLREIDEKLQDAEHGERPQDSLKRLSRDQLRSLLKELDQFIEDRQNELPVNWMRNIFENRYGIKVQPNPIQMKRFVEEALVSSMPGNDQDEKRRVYSEVAVKKKEIKEDNR